MVLASFGWVFQRPSAMERTSIRFRVLRSWTPKGHEIQTHERSVEAPRDVLEPPRWYGPWAMNLHESNKNSLTPVKEVSSHLCRWVSKLE